MKESKEKAIDELDRLIKLHIKECGDTWMTLPRVKRVGEQVIDIAISSERERIKGIIRIRKTELGVCIQNLDESGKINSMARKVGEARLSELQLIEKELLEMIDND